METKTCNRCGETKPVDGFHRNRRTPDGRHGACASCRGCEVKRLRAQVIEAYGGRCACCGETTPEFLSVDHINNDGGQHRRNGLSGPRFYRWLKATGFPKDAFTLLCFNCNCAKGFFGGCPHQRAKGGAA